MLQSEVVQKLTSCFTDFQSKLVSRVICVDYVPLTYWYNNTELYCVIQAEPGENISVVFKPHFISDFVVNGVLRSKICRFNRVLHGLRTARNILQSSVDDTLTDEQLTRLVAVLPVDLMSHGADHLNTYSYMTDAFKQQVSDLKELIDDLISIRLSIASVASKDMISKLKCIIDRIISIYNELRDLPDTLEDLISFVSEIYGAKVDIEAVTDISEVSAKNILTSNLSVLQKQKTLDKFLFLANYELLHLFNGRFSRTHRFSVAHQRTFQALPEFVPIAMKFSGVPNPLLDVNARTCMLEELKQKYRYLSNTELCTNYCSFKGSIVDRTGIGFDYGDPETYNTSRIIYGLVSDINDAFCSSGLMITPQVDPKVKGNSLVYTTELAACLLYLTLIDATATIGLKTGETYLFDKDILNMYMGLVDNEGKFYVEYCTPFSSLNSGDSSKGYTGYIDSLLFRAAVNDYVSHPNILDSLHVCEQLKQALFETQNQRRLSRIGVEL